METYGSLDISYQYFFKEIEGRDPSRPMLTLSVKNSGELNKYWNYKLSPYFSYDGLSEVEEQETLFDVEEAYIEFEKNIFSFKLGWLQQNWGVTEGFDPAAVLQSYRLWNPLDMQALASPSLQATWSWSSSLFEVFMVSQRRKTELPQPKSRWLPEEYIDSELVVDDNIIVLPSDPQYSYASYEQMNKAREWNLGVRYFQTIDSFDFSLFFFEGASPVPLTQIGLTVDSVGVIDGKDAFFLGQDIQLTPIDYRLRTLGGSTVLSIGRSILRHAWHYQDAVGDNAAVPDWQRANVLAWEFSPLASGKLISLFEYSNVERAGELNSTVSSIGRIFDEAYLLGLRYELSEKWSLYGSYLYDSVYGDQVHNITVTGRIRDSLTLKLLWINIEEKDKSTALAGYTKNDQTVINLEYFF